MKSLNSLRADVLNVISEIDGGCFDTDEIVGLLRDMIEYMGAGLTDSDEPDRVALLSVWATSMYARHKGILITIEPRQTGIWLRADLLVGAHIEPRHEGGPAIKTIDDHTVEQLIFWNDSRPNSWLRMLCENRAEQLLDEAYYSVAERPED